MPKFVLTYRTPVGYRLGGPDAMAAWNEWFQGIQRDLVEFGNPVFERTTLGKTGDDTNLGGYSIVSAEDLVTRWRKAVHAKDRGGLKTAVLTSLSLQDGIPGTVDDVSQLVEEVDDVREALEDIASPAAAPRRAQAQPE